MTDNNPTISVITLNINVDHLNAPIKRQTLSEWIKKTRPNYTLPLRNHFK